MDLFQAAEAKDPGRRPLAERMRPRTLDEILGQEQILGPGRALRRLLQAGELPSMILWGPPGSGKTTLARILAAAVEADIEAVSAVMSGVKELREVVGRAKERRTYHRRRTLLFIDEIHRFNKAQQDALLPNVESGLLTLIGATTENPSFEVNAALLSRCRVFVLAGLDEAALATLLRRALGDRERGLASPPAVDDEVLATIAAASHGDARRALGTLEVASELCRQAGRTALDAATVEEAVQHKSLLYDKAGDEHYGVISAFIKSMRGSDPDAAVYWLARMLEAGEDPRFLLRRMVIFASEDVGNADPAALQVAVSALQAYELVGLPEGVLPLTQAATYLACAPKSNAVLVAYGAARKDVRERGPLPVPPKLLPGSTALQQQLGHGKAYRYPHDFAGNYVPEAYLPDALEGRRYYDPRGAGHEAEVRARLERWRAQRAPSSGEPAAPEPGADAPGANAPDPTEPAGAPR